MGVITEVYRYVDPVGLETEELRAGLDFITEGLERIRAGVPPQYAVIEFCGGLENQRKLLLHGVDSHLINDRCTRAHLDLSDPNLAQGTVETMQEEIIKRLARGFQEGKLITFQGFRLNPRPFAPLELHEYLKELDVDRWGVAPPAVLLMTGFDLLNTPSLTHGRPRIWEEHGFEIQSWLETRVLVPFVNYRRTITVLGTSPRDVAGEGLKGEVVFRTSDILRERKTYFI